MGKVGAKKAPPIILEGVGWKRRSGFGRYSDTLGVGGSSWERRRFALTPTKLCYYTDGDSTKTLQEETPRGALDILPERATITATYPGEHSQPTPYALTVKVSDGMGGESIKWKLCFDDRETQLVWLVALTDIVADASVKEFNAKVLSAEADKLQHGGFHRLYEEGDHRLLDLVHTALLSGDRKRRKDAQKKARDEHIAMGARSHAAKEVQMLSTHSHDATLTSLGDTTVASSVSTSPVSAAPTGATFFGGADRKEVEGLPAEKLYHSLAVVAVSFAYERWAGADFFNLWQIVSAVILYICFSPTESTGEKEAKSKGAADESNEVRNRLQSPTKKVVIREEADVSPLKPSVTKSALGAELMKADRVPMSDMPSERFSPKKPNSAAHAEHRLEPLTEDEMGAHLHERWAMSAPDVDLSGEWTLIVDDAFKQEYDGYLKQLGFNGITRKVACSLISRTTEITKQSDNGRELYLKGTNPKGAWERTLSASGYPDFETHTELTEGEDYSHTKSSIKTADSEDVDAEAWWEDRGSKHRSWLRGGKKYGGGDFESLRYIEEGSEGNVLVCESIFHPRDPSKKKAVVTWRFQRD